MNKASENYDIAIIGGGMVGASLALLSARQNPNWKIALLDAQAFDLSATYQPSFDSRSTAISYGSVEILKSLGLWAELAKHATAIKQVHVSDAGHFMGGLIDSETYHVPALGFVIPNYWLGQVLQQHLHQQKNIQLLAPLSVEKIIPRQQGATLMVASESDTFSIQCALAVVADGGDSPLRAALGIDVDLKDYGQTAIIANVAFSKAHAGVAYERFTTEGPLALLPLGESPDAQESALVLTVERAEAQEINALNDQAFLQYLQRRFGYRLGNFLRVSKRVSYQLKLTAAKEQVRSHLVLVGNAAHFLHPVAGQGFNLSLRDCACLVEALRSGEQAGKTLGELSVLQHFLQQQALDQTLTIEFSDKLVRLFSNNNLPLTALRHLGFIGLDLLPAVKSKFASQTMGTAGALFL